MTAFRRMSAKQVLAASVGPVLAAVLVFGLATVASAQPQIAKVDPSRPSASSTGGAASNVAQGEDAAACATGAPGSAVLVNVSGFKDRGGQVRVELYSDRKDEFLKGRRKLEGTGAVFRRIKVPTPQAGDAQVCVQLPAPGRYAIAVLHDRDADNKLGVFKDGYGFSRNPKLGMGKPDVEKVAFDAAHGVTPVDVILNYFNGRFARPVEK